MSVVAAYACFVGRRTGELSIGDLASLAVREGEFVWIGLVEPAEEELKILQELFARRT